tara:strand:+ start:173 stop:526 length:354 start_codon:yes stop_codon:yes gene_type:complete
MDIKSSHVVSLFLRFGLVISFLYAGVSIFLNPISWIGFVPAWLGFPEFFLYFHAVLEILLAFWLISNKKIFYASIVSIIFLASIIIFNLGALDIIFRDITILFSAIALAFLSYKNDN